MIMHMELVIKAAVSEEGNAVASQGSSPSTSNNSVSQTEEIIKTCVDRVLGILKDKNER